MDSPEYVATLRKYKYLILALGVVGTIAGLVFASTMPTLYQARSSVFVSSQRGETSSELLQGSTFTQNLVQTYATLATTPAVLNPVIDRLNLDTSPQALARSITADAPINTVIIEITVQNGSAAQAARIADAVTDSLARTAEDLSPADEEGNPSIIMETVSPAQTPSAPASPNVRLIVVSGLLAGLALGVTYAFGRVLLDTRVRSKADIARLTDVPVLGSIAQMKRGTAGVVMRVAPRSSAAEDYRRLRTNLAFADIDEVSRSVVVTSASAGAGKTVTSINLALAMAEAGRTVLLIDADLRRPAVAQYCEIDGDVGLTSVLLGTSSFDLAVQRWGDAIDIIPSGIVPPNPVQLLTSAAMATLIAEIEPHYDFVVIDSPPLLPVSDALALAPLVDGAIVISRVGVTKRNELTSTLEALDAVNSRVLGVVLNRSKPSRANSYYGRGEDQKAATPPQDQAAAPVEPSDIEPITPTASRGPRP
ncbi:polysaccharide biosynthesis tyrosine autokinase [Marisediminicola sp. LYQ134]|uniref:polysaccharide biosynthesis tyrosine autokinase n=1 Tax=Marisediminicola sp. LYQ134 TaxID=3391061 RepID=UPI0039837DAE